MMLPVAQRLDDAGFDAIEVMGSGHFKKCIRDLKEDPWQKLSLLAERIRRTPMGFMMLPSVTTFDITPFSVLEAYITRLAARGIRRFQLMESSNDMGHRIPESMDFIRKAGGHAALALVYSISPRHTDEYYVRKAVEAARLKPQVIYLKDPAGLLTPERTRSIVPVLLAALKDTGVPLELHSHCTTGLAPICYLEAMKLGIRVVHTGIPPLANGAAQPSVFNVARNAELLGYRPRVDLDWLRPVSEHFHEVARRERMPVGAPLEYDVSQYLHHVPGGVISHLKRQIGQLGMEQRLQEVLEEVARVRTEFGYPIMVTPFSQFVGSQAALNVMLGERYKQVSDEVIQFALGHWGREAAESMDAAVRDRILQSPRARELSRWEPPQPSIAEVRSRLGGAGLSDEELLLRFIAPVSEIDAMRAAGAPKLDCPARGSSIVKLVRELSQRDDLRSVYVSKGDAAIRLSGR
jgi:oxaloacetate decarboxylase alpha subunit